MTDKIIMDQLSRIESDLISDRTRFEDRFNKIEESLAAINIRLESLQSRVPHVQTKLKDAVSEAMAETMAPITDLMDKIQTNPKKKNLLDWIKNKKAG